MIKQIKKHISVIEDNHHKNHLAVILHDNGFNDIWYQEMYHATICIAKPSGDAAFIACPCEGMYVAPIARFCVNLGYVPITRRYSKLDLLAESSIKTMGIYGKDYPVDNETIGSPINTLRHDMYNKMHLISKGLTMLHHEFIPYAHHHRLLAKIIHKYGVSVDEDDTDLPL